MPAKTEQLQIRVTAAQKTRLRQLARRAGEDVSAYVLARALPESRARFDRVLRALRDETHRRFALAELADLLAPMGPDDLAATVADADVAPLSAFAQNYVAATVEYLCAKHGAVTPGWAEQVAPLDTPWFATTLKSVRLHLLRASPVAFARRNLFIDAGPDARV